LTTVGELASHILQKAHVSPAPLVLTAAASHSVVLALFHRVVTTVFDRRFRVLRHVATQNCLPRARIRLTEDPTPHETLASLEVTTCSHALLARWGVALIDCHVTNRFASAIVLKVRLNDLARVYGLTEIHVRLQKKQTLVVDGLGDDSAIRARLYASAPSIDLPQNAIFVLHAPLSELLTSQASLHLHLRTVATTCVAHLRDIGRIHRGGCARGLS